MAIVARHHISVVIPTEGRNLLFRGVGRTAGSSLLATLARRNDNESWRYAL
jgi:hypothetical protein